MVKGGEREGEGIKIKDKDKDVAVISVCGAWDCGRKKVMVNVVVENGVVGCLWGEGHKQIVVECNQGRTALLLMLKKRNYRLEFALRRI